MRENYRNVTRCQKTIENSGLHQYIIEGGVGQPVRMKADYNSQYPSLLSNGAPSP